MLPGDSAELRKRRGAFFTPLAIAEHLADWALRGPENEGLVLDPTCGDGVFLLAAAQRLDQCPEQMATSRLFGVDVHDGSLRETDRLLAQATDAKAELLTGDFLEEPTPDQLGARLPYLDAVIGNPPFVRYQEHRGEARRRGAAAALAQGVRLSGLASSWAALLVHASAFLKPKGRIAMVLPAELLSVGYAKPIRVWLRQRFSSLRHWPRSSTRLTPSSEPTRAPENRRGYARGPVRPLSPLSRTLELVYSLTSSWSVVRVGQSWSG